jgi:hypothetical protein
LKFLPELGEVRAQCVDGLCALPDEQLAHAVLHELRLLLRRLSRYCADRWSSDGLAARRSIDRIVLAALDVRHHVLAQLSVSSCNKIDAGPLLWGAKFARTTMSLPQASDEVPRDLRRHMRSRRAALTLKSAGLDLVLRAQHENKSTGRRTPRAL